MSAERDVQRLLSQWLAEEAGVRAPDRVLESARQTIDQTRQRRVVAAWREPVTLSMTKAAALAAALVLALAGAAWAGRSTAPDVGAPAGTTSPTPAPTPAGVTMESYRGARNAICVRYYTTVEPLKPQLEGLHDPETSPADRSAKARVLLDIVTQLEAMVAELDTLDAPAELVEDHAEYVARYQDMNLLIRQILARLNQGDLEGAAVVDDALNVLNGPMLAFENANELDVCP